MRAVLALAVSVATVTISNPCCAQTSDPIAPYRARREAAVEGFRLGGVIDAATLTELARDLAAAAQNESGEAHARALMELGTVLRINNDYAGAIVAQTEAAQQAGILGLKDLAFDAWIGVSRSNEYGPADHGAAAAAFDRAFDAAGDHPSEKQRADLTDYLAQLEIGRGEFEAGIIDALLAIRLTQQPKDRFYAELDLADGLQKLAVSCDFHPLHDAKSSEDHDPYGACHRAVAAAGSAYAQAESTAASLGWTHLVRETRAFESRLELRDKLIDVRASTERMSFGNVFHPRSSRDVLASRDFQAGASTLTDVPGLASLIESVVAEADAKTGRKDARSDYLLGLAKDIRNASPEEAAQYFTKAAGMLAVERNGFFDPRRRGTVIENRGDIVRDLAIRLLSLGRESDAFAAFESVRARGLGELAAAMARPEVGTEDRRWLADLLVVEAKTSAIEHRIVADIVATGRPDAQADKLQALDDLRMERQAALKGNEAARSRFDLREPAPPVPLAALQAATAGTGIPVLLYWTTSASVIAWYVGPDGSDVRSVFLPASVLDEKIRSVTATSGGSFGKTPFDEATARELFLYLLGPFTSRLSSASVHEILIVPQGTLAGLPFEALIDPESGASVVDRWAVSYAPNAAMAVAALERPTRPVRTVTALVDPVIDVNTNETANIRAAGVDLATVTRSWLLEGAWRSDALHVLMHGEFDPSEALLSSVAPSGRPGESITAAALTALPLRGLRLAVLSACKGGQVEARISGEIYGFPWALAAGGVEATVLSRWDVNAESNGEWMGTFYREVAGGAPVPLAAATAMREMRKSGRTHPYYWAAMQVSGR